MNLVFLGVIFMLWYILLRMHVCFCVCFSFSVLSQKRLARKNVSEMTYFVSSGTYNHTSIQSVINCQRNG